MRFFILTSVLLVFSLNALAQQTLGSTVVNLGPFEDVKMDNYIQDILFQMDGFHADSAIILIGNALGYINPDIQKEEAYYLLSYRAEVLYYEGLFNEAMTDLDKCLPIALELQDSSLISNIYNLKGLLNETIENHAQALEFYKKALKIYPLKPAARYPISELHHIYGNIGSELIHIGLYDSAQVCLDFSLRLARISGAQRAIAVAYWSMGELELKRNESVIANERFQSSLKEAESAADRDISLDAILGSATALKAQENTQGALLKLAEGTEHLNTYLEGIGLVTQRRYARGSARIYQKIGYPNEAIEQLSEWHRLDSLIQNKNINTALNTQAAFIRSESDLELEQLKVVQANAELDVLRTRQILYLTLGLIVLFTLIMVYAFRRRKQIQQEELSRLELIRAKQEKAISEFKVREQVGRDLHDDLGAGLSALKLKCEMTLRSERDPTKAQSFRSISELSKEIMESMRQVIWSLNMDLNSLDDLVVYTTNYARNYLAENQVELQLHKDDQWPDVSLSPEQRRNVFLVVKEALYNTVKHANATKVEFHIQWENGLHVKLKDNGIGLQSTIPSVSGNGIRNMKKRISDLGSELKIGGEIGTEISFKLDFTSNKSSIPNSI